MIDGRRCHVERMKINDTHLFFCLFLYRLSTAVTKIQLHCMGYDLLEKTNRKGKAWILIKTKLTVLTLKTSLDYKETICITETEPKREVDSLLISVNSFHRRD